jgi:hypothetical protein
MPTTATYRVRVDTREWLLQLIAASAHVVQAIAGPLWAELWLDGVLRSCVGRAVVAVRVEPG